MSTLEVARLEARGVIELSGDAPREFLQGLVTVDVRRLSPEASLWGALLTPQGKYLFDFFITAGEGDSVRLECDAAALEDLLRRLTMYRLRRRIAIEDRSDAWRVLVFMGEPDALGLEARPGVTRQQEGAALFVDPRLPALGVRALVPAALADQLIADTGAQPVQASRYLERRLQLGVPEGPADLLPQKSLPLECNFEELNAVDFGKGCFVGQEVTARMHYRARPRKRLLPLRLPTPVEPGTPIRSADGRDAGVVQRVWGGLGLGLVRLEPLSRADALPLTAGDLPLQVTWPDWLPVEEKNPLQDGGDAS